MTDEERQRDREARRERSRKETQDLLKNMQHVPKLQRQWISRPYQWAPPCEDIESDEEPVSDPYERELTIKWAKADAAWRQIYHMDKTAREYAEWHISDRVPVLMSTKTLQEAKQQVDECYFVGMYPKHIVFAYVEGLKISPNNPEILTFVEEVEKYRFMSFDTEGDGKLPRKSSTQNDRLFVALSSPVTAMVLMFHDSADMPNNLRELLASYSVAKIQSGVCGDVMLMEKVGLNVRGVIDSGTLLLLIKPGSIESGFGAKRQLKEIWPDKDCHVPYEWQTFGKAFSTQQLTTKSMRHVVQDVLMPFAFCDIVYCCN
jgi:hypothetical protein